MIKRTGYVNLRKREGIQESKTLGYMLTFVAGFLVAYSYQACGKVFASGLTGNLLFMGFAAHDRNLYQFLRYAQVIASFSIGVIIANIIKQRIDQRKLKIKNYIINIYIEMLLIVLVLFIPHTRLDHILITLCCGIQIENFDMVRGYPVSTVNFVGNVKSAADAVTNWIFKKQNKELKHAIILYLFMLFFFLGCVFGLLVIDNSGKNALLFPLFILMICVFETKLEKKQ